MPSCGISQSRMKAPIRPTIRSPISPKPPPAITRPASQPGTMPTTKMTKRLWLERYMANPPRGYARGLIRCREKSSTRSRRNRRAQLRKIGRARNRALMRRHAVPARRIPGEGGHVLHAPISVLNLAGETFRIEALDLILHLGRQPDAEVAQIDRTGQQRRRLLQCDTRLARSDLGDDVVMDLIHGSHGHRAHDQKTQTHDSSSTRSRQCRAI